MTAFWSIAIERRSSHKQLVRSRATSRLVIATIALIGLILTMMPSSARADEGSRELVFTSGSTQFATTLRLTFEKPITSSEKQRIVRELTGTRSQVGPMAIMNLSCNDTYAKTTSEGSWEVQYRCFPEYATLPWGFKISSSVKKIIVSNVTEDGLWWWRNGVRQTKLARHVVPKDYLFHGTMKKVWNGDSINYQDYFTFRHNVGSGGTGAIAIAGTFTVG